MRMKRNYVTPVIAVEHYSLTQSIAACGIKINVLNTECVLNDSDSSQYMINMAQYAGWFMDCPTMAEGMDPTDGFCYNTSANATFAS